MISKWISYAPYLNNKFRIEILGSLVLLAAVTSVIVAAEGVELFVILTILMEGIVVVHDMCPCHYAHMPSHSTHRPHLFHCNFN